MKYLYNRESEKKKKKKRSNQLPQLPVLPIGALGAATVNMHTYGIFDTMARLLYM